MELIFLAVLYSFEKPVYLSLENISSISVHFPILLVSTEYANVAGLV
jgi:hypothetical protein